MYGTTMKSYNSSKYHKNDTVETKAKKKNRDKAPTTRYMKINERKYDKNNYETTSSCEAVKEGFSKKEFPIASVIFTAIATMIVLLLTTGVIG
ncbi:MAG: hypothetical protein II984_08505 [Clostridia bacterium]|nr:hypothetical protein [Clostridia bacterium]